MCSGFAGLLLLLLSDYSEEHNNLVPSWSIHPYQPWQLINLTHYREFLWGIVFQLISW